MEDFCFRGGVPRRFGDVGEEEFAEDGSFGRRGRGEDVELFAFFENARVRQEVAQHGGGGDFDFRRAFVNERRRLFCFFFFVVVVHKKREIQPLVVVVDKTKLEKCAATTFIGVIVKGLRSGAISAHRRVQRDVVVRRKSHLAFRRVSRGIEYIQARTEEQSAVFDFRKRKRAR